MTDEKPPKDTPKPKKTERLEDLEPEQDPKGGLGAADEPPVRTSLNRGGWDGNHNQTSVARLRRRQKARR
jgi:hypothetical protein